MNTITRRITLGSVMLLMAIGSATAAIKQQPLPLLQEQTTSMRSFHETTELAETLWTEFTARFVTLYENGQYAEAKKMAQRAYEIADNSFGIDDVNTADSLLKLGIINQTLGNLPAAEDFLLSALVILEDKLSPDHPDIAVALTNLGNVYFELGDNKSSEQYHQKALALRTNALGKGNPAVAQSMYNLAVLYENNRDYAKAESYYQEAIELWTEQIGATHPYVQNALNNLTNTYIAQSKLIEAAETQQNLVHLKKAVFGEQHEEVAKSLIDLGALYVEQGNYVVAGHAYEEALHIAEQVLQPSDPQLAMLMYTLANIYHIQARMSDTTQSTEQPTEQTWVSDATTEAKVRQQHDQTTTLFEQARPLYERAAAILDTKQNPNASALQVVLSELAMLYKAIGADDKALATESRISLAQ